MWAILNMSLMIHDGEMQFAKKNKTEIYILGKLLLWQCHM